MNIGIFGGCFNPSHNMHKQIATELIKKKYLDKVIFLPTGDSYKKAELIGIEERVAMLNILLQDKDFEISDISKGEKYRYTFEALDYYHKKYKEDTIYFICGTDNLKEFDTWKNYQYILSNYKLLVIPRNKDNISDIVNKYKKYAKNILIADINENLVSSTIVRNYIKSGKKEDLIEIMDKEVLKYIFNKGLYKI